MIARPCWELRGSRGKYGVVFVARNGEILFSNRVQGYVEKRDALHSLEVLYRGKQVVPIQGGWGIDGGFYLAEVRDATDKAQAGKGKGDG